MDSSEDTPHKKLTLWGAVNKWFNMLLGRPTTTLDNPPDTGGQESLPTSEDSVAQDVLKARNFIKKLVSSITLQAKPSIEAGGQGVKKGLNKALGSSFLKRILKIFVLVILIIAVLSFSIKFLKRVEKDDKQIDGVSITTPTPVEYKFDKPSIYAEDEAFLKLEEEVRILENEVNQTDIRETRLAPPPLDFNVSF